MSKDLTFVIGRASSNKATIANHRFKWRSLPKLQGIRRLDIVMSVNENCFPISLVIISSQNDRITVGGKFLGIEACLLEALEKPICTRFNLGFKLRISRHGWKAKKVD